MKSSCEPLVLLHGALVSHAMWRPQVAFFGASRRVLALDLPAHGQSPDVPGPYTVDAIATAVMQQIDRALGDVAFDLVGHSLGGMVAQRIAQQSQRVCRLVLAETSFGTQSTAIEKLGTLMARAFLAITPYRVTVRVSASRYGLLDESVADFVRSEMARFDAKSAHRVMAAALDFDGEHELASIRQPTLVLVGEQNPITHEQGRRIAKTVADGRFAVVPHASHLLNLDNPAAFNTLVSDFLSARRRAERDSPGVEEATDASPTLEDARRGHGD